MIRGTPKRCVLSNSGPPGSTGQKHMSLDPTLFLYRVPRYAWNPGYSVMKSWWTLGAFPTGRDTPIRINEFKEAYVKRHVPEEVEEWLHFFITDPVAEIEPVLDKLLIEFERSATHLSHEGSLSKFYQPPLPTVASLLPAVRKFEEVIGVNIPATCVRGLCATENLKESLMDELCVYADHVKIHGSTTHRRVMRAMMEEDHPVDATPFISSRMNTQKEINREPLDLTFPDPSQSSVSCSIPVPPLPPDVEFCAKIGAVFNVEEDKCEPDELSLVKMLTYFAEGGVKMRKYSDAVLPLTSALRFSHNGTVRGEVHANIASALNKDGRFEEAEVNAKEAIMLCRSKRGFANLAVALAYQEKHDEALSVADDGLAMFPQDPMLAKMRDDVLESAASKPSGRVRVDGHTIDFGRRGHTKSEQFRGLLYGSGSFFNNSFDSFRSDAYTGNEDRMVHFSLNISDDRLGNVARRSNVGLSVASNSSNRIEPY
eukprot:Tbor_TRINITY_DN5270_c0_g2::TRINITY_DN5270_c0_g2_i1::g.16770::m.16770